MDYSETTRKNAAAVHAAEAAGEPIVPAYPLKFNFDFTAECNLHCFMCLCESHRNEQRAQGVKGFSMPVESFRQAATKVFPHCSIVNPSLVGEPLMLPYLDELVTLAGQYRVLLDIVTNGMLLREKRCRQLLPILHALTVSWDGCTPATFAHIRTGAKMETVASNLTDFSRLRREAGLRERVRLRFSVTLMRDNIAELPGIVELAAAHDVDLVLVNYMIACNDELAGHTLDQTPELTRQFIPAARQKAAELGIAINLPQPLGMTEPSLQPPGLVNEWDDLDSPIRRPPPGWPGKHYCRFPWREVFVAPGGELSPCCAPGRPIMGNAFSSDFSSLWNGPEYQRLREGFITGRLTDYCRNCPFI